LFKDGPFCTYADRILLAWANNLFVLTEQRREKKYMQIPFATS